MRTKTDKKTILKINTYKYSVMIKEIFEIEPVQKNTLIIFIAIFSLSFLQLYLFKHSIFEENYFVIIGVCIGLSVCWSIINMPPLVFYHAFLLHGKNNIKTTGLNYIIFKFGLLAIGWIILLTYIGYEYKFCFKELIRFSILLSFIKTFIWFILGIKRNKVRLKNKQL